MEAERSPNHCPPQSTEPHPWLLLWHGENNEHQTFYTITKSGDSQVEWGRSFLELQGKKVICCSCGWLGLLENKDEFDQFSLWNPASLDSITLPPCTTKFSICCALLTSPPSTTNSWFLIFDDDGPNILCIRLDRDDRQWVVKRFGEQMELMEVFKDPFRKACCCSGIVICMTEYNECLALDTDPDNGPVIIKTLTSKPFRGGLIPSIDSYSHLVESQGYVFGIDIFFSGIEGEEVVRIEIFRFNWDTEEWEDVQSAKDQVFFLGDDDFSGVCCPTLSSDQERGGRIYFTCTNNKLIYSYKIAKRSLSMAFRFPDSPMTCSTTAWIMPNYRLDDDQVKMVNEVDQEGETMVEVKKYIIEESGCKDSKGIDLLSFPETVLEELADRLPLLDYMNFRLVCRRFSMAAPAISRQESCLLPPCLMFVGQYRRIYNLIDTKFNGRYFMRIPDELEGATICSSKNGWLLLSKNEVSMFFYNPFTKAVLRCPDIPYMSLPFARFVVLSDPSSSECLVVGISAFDEDFILGILSYPHDQNWTWLDFPNLKPNSQVFWNGAFYFLGEKGNLGVLKREEEAGDYSWNVLDDLKPPCEPFTFNWNFLVECDQDLLSIFVGDYGKWVRVFRLDQSGLVWNQVYSLGNKTLYLSRSSSFSTVAMYEEMENRIYFPRLHRGSLVFYSLDTHKLHSSNCPEDSLVDFCGSSEQLLCGWIEPKWS